MFKKVLASPVFSVAAFVLAAALLIFSSVGGARAALGDPSQLLYGGVSMEHIGISLYENDLENPVSYRNYNYEKSDDVTTNWIVGGPETLIGDISEVEPGKAYDEKLYVGNTGGIDQFTRVIVQTYWVDEKGNKDLSMDPTLIKLHFNEDEWTIDKDASVSSNERTVLYLNHLLPVGEKSMFADSFMIDSSIKNYIAKENVSTRTEGGIKYTTYTKTYTYDGRQFKIEVTADAVQDHNAEAAIKSSWGRDVTISGTTLTLK